MKLLAYFLVFMCLLRDMAEVLLDAAASMISRFGFRVLGRLQMQFFVSAIVRKSWEHGFMVLATSVPARRVSGFVYRCKASSTAQER